MNNEKHGKKNKSLTTVVFFVTLFILYFFCRFLLFSEIFPPIGLEECHTGAVASEIINHGFQFPIEQYTPEFYETTIIIASLITIIPVYIFGLIPFSIELVPFLLSFGVLAVCCTLLIKSGFKDGVWYFVAFFFFGSEMFVYLSMDSVGSHLLALILCMLILHSFYNFCISGRKVYFYLFAFFAGTGAFVYISTLMYTMLCVFVFVIHFLKDKEFKTRVTLERNQIISGIALFAIGYAPSVFFLIKTGGESVGFIRNLFDRRVVDTSESEYFFDSLIDGFLFQFDYRLWLPVVFFILFVICGFYILKLRKQTARFNSYFMLVILFVSIIPLLCAIVLLNGRAITSYYIYLFPMLFMMTGAVLSLILESLDEKPKGVRAVAGFCVFAILTFVLVKNFAPVLNFSVRDSYRVYVEDRESAFCYWRFGKAFSNYTKPGVDPVEYSKRIASKCDRFDTVEKRNECYLGWGAEKQTSILDDSVAKVLGKRKIKLLANGFGRWENRINFCVSGAIPVEYIGDCISGFLEQQLLKLHSNPYMQGGVLIYYPCLADFDGYTGLRNKMREELRQGTIESEAQKCEERFNDVRAIMTGYCAAKNLEENKCDKVCGSNDYIALCDLIYSVETASIKSKMELETSQ